MINYKERQPHSIDDFDYWTCNGASLINPEKCYYKIPAIITQNTNLFDASFIFIMNSLKITINDTSLTLFKLCVERYNKYIVLKKSDSKYESKNKVLIPLNKNLYYNKKLEGEYFNFQLIRDKFNLKYEEVVLFIKEIKKLNCFVVIKGSFFKNKTTLIGFRGYKYLNYNNNILSNLSLLVTLMNYQEELIYSVTSYYKNIKECFIKIKQLKNDSVENKIRNQNIDLFKINKKYRKAEKKTGSLGLQYYRVFRDDGKKGGRIYNLLTQTPKYIRNEIYNILNLKELDIVSAQLKMIDTYLYPNVKSGEKDFYIQLINKCPSIYKNKHKGLLRSYAKQASSIYINASNRSYAQRFIHNEFEKNGLIYTDNEIQHRRNVAYELKQKRIEKIYKNYLYVSELNSLKHKRIDRFNENFNEKNCLIAKHFTQKSLKAFTFEIQKALEELYPSYVIDKIKSKLELPESNALIQIISSNNALIGIHDCIIVEKGKRNNIKNLFVNFIENEMLRLKKGIISYSFKKIINLKKSYFSFPQTHWSIYNTNYNEKTVLLC